VVDEEEHWREIARLSELADEEMIPGGLFIDCGAA